VTAAIQSKLKRLRWLTGIFMAGLLVSGLTAIPLVDEVDALVAVTGVGELRDGAGNVTSPGWAGWLLRVQQALHETRDGHPLLFYGTDWLAFGHVMIAIAFIGAWRDPVRNAWLFDFGLIACALVIPWALIFGHLRGIPLWWRLIDCSFGVLGALPLLAGKRILYDLATCSNPPPHRIPDARDP
jgi:hypothetical protein